MTFLLVALAAAAGAAARFVLDALVQSRSGGAHPWGTFAVNVSGSLALGLVVGFMSASGPSASWGVVVGTGFLGSYTTFSTLMVETVRMMERRAWSPALLYVGGSWAAGTAAAAAGLWAAMLAG
jgi:fluoride exporter